MTNRRRRTLQYAPANSEEKVRAAAESAADGVILDLESTVEAADKGRAREDLDRLFAEVDFGDKETVVRINGFRSDHWLADLTAAVEAGADTIRLPKIEEPWQIRTIVETTKQLADEVPEFLVQLETPEGILAGEEIAETCGEYPRVTGIGVGIGDYTKSLWLDGHTPDMQTFLLNRIAAFAAVGDMDPLAYVHKDPDTLREAAERAKSLGHVGQPVSHAADTEAFVDVLNDVYSE